MTAMAGSHRAPLEVPHLDAKPRESAPAVAGGTASSAGTFRPDLEGLRAVAVVLILGYHASVPLFSGGYVGVDVFYVLSGFLITGLLLREVRQTGTISLPSFYARRARRLLPAAALVLVVTVAASAVLMTALEVPEVSGDAAAAALYVSNVRFALQATDYLRADLAPSPILHYWSLSVEEQFYLFWPAAVLLIARGRGEIGRRLATVAAVISVASFVLAVWLTQVNAPWAFFSLPTRAWELGIGALLAVGAGLLARTPVRLATVAAWAGLAMVIASSVVLKRSTPFPGVAALLPTVGSALLIAGGFRQSAFAPGRWLSTAIPRFLGRISYSLYLWHWPLLILPSVAIGDRLPWWARGALVLVAIGLAAVTQRWVEDPLRHGRWIGTRPRRNLALAGALTLVVSTVALGVGARAASTLPAAGSTTSLATDEAELDAILAAAPSLPATPGGPIPAGLRPGLREVRDTLSQPYIDGCRAQRLDTEVGPCTYGDPASPVTVVLFGDSHALAWFPTLDRLATERHWRLVMLGKVACQPADMVLYSQALKRDYTECTTWREAALQRIAAERPALVLVTSHIWFTGAALIADWRAGMARTLDRLTASAERVVVIADTPRSAFNLPDCVTAHLDDVLACATPYATAVNERSIERQRQAAESGGADFVDPSAWICPSRPCPAVIGHFLVFRDDDHMTPPFAAALADWLGRALEPLPGPEPR